MAGGGVGWWGLGEDDSGGSGRGESGDGADLELQAAEDEGGRGFVLAGGVWHGDGLGAEGFGDAHLPAAADAGSGDGGLREDVIGADGAGVEAVFNRQIEAEIFGHCGCIGVGFASQVGNGDLAAVDGDTHGEEGAKDDDGEHQDRAGGDVDDALDGGEDEADARHDRDQDTGLNC